MIRGKFLGCLVAIFFLLYNIILIQSSFAQNAQVTDMQPPSVEAPQFIIARATSPSWTQVNFQVNATSPSSDNISVYCNPSSGSAFPMGSTIVLCAAKDPITSLVSYAMFNVTVKDTSPPTFKVPNSILRQADNLQGTKITYDANASDTVDGSAVTTCEPPSGTTFPLGLNQVKCTATDKSGNTAETSFSVIIGQTPSEEIGGNAISMLSQNGTNQLKSPEFPVSENITDDSTPEFPVSENITDDSTPPLENLVENDTDDLPIQQLADNLNENNGLIKVTIDSLQTHRAAEGSLLKIKGVSVHDSGNEKLSFTWKQTGGQPIDPEDARIISQTAASEIAPQIGGNTTNLTFEVTVPDVNTENDDKLTFEIIALDDNGNSASDSFDILVDDNPEFVGTGNFQSNPNVLQSVINEVNEENNNSDMQLSIQRNFEKSIGISTSLDKGFSFVNMWGSFGKGNGRFDGQNDVDPFNGRVYVADYANHRIQVFDTKGNYITKWGTYGEENGQIHKASALTVAPSGNIYLSDQFNYRIQEFSSNGTFVTAWGTKGEGDGQFLHPHVPGVDSEGNIYVSDRDLANVQKFTKDGKFIMKWAEEGSEDGQLSKPESVIIDSHDNIYVADFGNHRIQKFSNDGQFILKWGTKGVGDGEFNGPAGLSIDRNDNIYVTDRNNNRIQVFTADGTFLTKFGI
ncbi:MAG TPA: HYR domain-containing protein, partial [Nitrososphaeraceae archaeon]|nr:HYR domain-containing protein [Nitrososphaeraceae archaeon]